MKKIYSAVIALVAVVGITFAPLTPVAVAAPVDEVRDGVRDVGGDEEDYTLPERIQDIVNILLFILGAVAVIMIIVGGFKYVTSDGDSSKITSAKNTILYAIAGVVVAILAYAIVNFIVGAFE